MKKAAVKIIVVVAMAAAVFVNAVLPVSANYDFMSFEYIAKDIFGIVYLSQTPLYVIPSSQSNTTNPNIMLIGNADNEPIVVLVPYEINGDVTYFIKNTAREYITLLDPIENTFSYPPATGWYLQGSSSTYNYLGWFGVRDYVYSRWSTFKTYYTITANHNISNMYTSSLPSDPLPKSQITVDTSLTIDDFIVDSGLKKEDIENAIISSLSSTTDTIITNQSTVIELLRTTNIEITNVKTEIQNVQSKIDTTNQNLSFIQTQINQIYNVGDGNTIPNNGQALDTAQQQLHNSEEALTNKSESLASRAASGINTAKTASTQFIGTITPAVTTVNGTVTQAIESLPQDIQPMVYSMPLLSFAVWLIGLKR